MDHTSYLRLFRKGQAGKEGVALNKVLTDPQISAIVKKRPRPQTKAQLRSVQGVGPVTINKYGDDILALLLKEESSERPPLPLSLSLPLSEEQSKVLGKAYRGDNVLMTGQGGVGKSFLIDMLISILEQKGDRVQVCALTGTASELLNCPSKTIHAWSGTRIIRGPPEDIVRRTVQNNNAAKAWRNVDVLIIDEVSMLSKKHFDILNSIGQLIRKNREPFGGIQLIFSGDFYQIPPIADSDPDSGCFCFESLDWHSIFPSQNVIELTKVFRQRDKLWLKILKQVRQGQGHYSRNTVKALMNRVVPCDPKDIPTIITPSRKNCQMINQREMAKLTAGTKTFIMDVTDNSKSYYPPQVVEGATRALKKSLMCESLTLKIGAEVMCLVNLDMESQCQIVNGSLGIVQGWTGGYPQVKFRNGRIHDMVKHEVKSDIVEGLSIRQVPLMPAWAITTHKSQGITLDSAVIDAGSDNFEFGQIYVALSRVKTLEGLYLSSFDHFKIKANPKVTAYYDSL